MANFNEAIKKTLKHEGGYVNDPSDRGGETNFGISKKAYPNENIRFLTRARAMQLYKRDYWDKIKGDEICSQLMASNIFDCAVNMGVATASRMAQQALGIIPADGIIGPISVGVINDVDDEHNFILAYALNKIGKYVSIVKANRSQDKYLLGWINRTLEGLK